GKSSIYFLRSKRKHLLSRESSSFAERVLLSIGGQVKAIALMHHATSWYRCASVSGADSRCTMGEHGGQKRLCPLRPGGLKKHVGLFDLDHGALVHEDDLVGNLMCKPQLVCDHEHGHAALCEF